MLYNAVVIQLREHLPARADGRSWLLVYSSDRDGFSLKTLYRSGSAHSSCPVLVIIRDRLLHVRVITWQ